MPFGYIVGFHPMTEQYVRNFFPIEPSDWPEQPMRLNGIRGQLLDIDVSQRGV